MSNNLFNLDSAMSEFVAKSKDAVNELQKIDTCLKHIQQTDKSLSDSDLVNIGTQAYEIAEKYDVKKLDEKQFIDEYKDYRYTFELIEK